MIKKAQVNIEEHLDIISYMHGPCIKNGDIGVNMDARIGAALLIACSGLQH